jgi:hypothetical protein
MSLYKNKESKVVVTTTPDNDENFNKPFKFLRAFANAAEDNHEISSTVLNGLNVAVAAPVELDDDEIVNLYATITSNPDQWEELPEPEKA